jgi:ribonuclease BN (tRNA processing enzyme)
LNIIALGTSGTYPRYGRACSGFLFADDPTFVLVDIGTGVLSNLFRYIDPSRLSAIIVTHLHPDHVLDLYPLRYYLQYSSNRQRKIPVYANSKASDVLHDFNPDDNNGEFLKTVFDFFEVEKIDSRDCKGCLTIGSLRFYFAPTKHLIKTYAVLCDTPEGKRIGYTSDTSYDENLIEFFKGCDILISEAAYQGKVGKENLHMTAFEAGKLARECGVKRLYLTHIWPELDPKISKAEAEKAFGSEVVILKEHMVIEI